MIARAGAYAALVVLGLLLAWLAFERHRASRQARGAAVAPAVGRRK